MFEKNLRLIMLFDIYGELLTQTQKTMFDLYYNDDLSLSEVAENTGITRQGARDSIKRAEETLLSLEEKLGLADKFLRIEKASEEAGEIVRRLKEKYPADAFDFDRILKLLESVKTITKVSRKRRKPCFRTFRKSSRKPLRNSGTKAR